MQGQKPECWTVVCLKLDRAYAENFERPAPGLFLWKDEDVLVKKISRGHYIERGELDHRFVDGPSGSREFDWLEQLKVHDQLLTIDCTPDLT